ncbi:MAG: hypothetical protein HYV97_04230 [Bdellovibrio sp.]|nr:hypothetical protein [Bdellovibrio sp.]
MISQLKKYVSIGLVILTPILVTFGSSDFPPNFEAIEKKALQILKDKKVDDDKLLLLYLMAGRELHDYDFLDKSEEYYQKAIDLAVDGAKAEAHINLVGIALNKNDKKTAIQRLENAEKYFAQHPKEKNPGIEEWLKTMDRVLRRAGQGAYTYKGFFGQYVALNDLQSYIEKKEYDKALAMLNPTSITEKTSPIVLISYDILQVLVYGKVEKKKLKCSPIAQKAKKGEKGYTVQICGILQSYLSSNKLSPIQLEKLEKYLSVVHEDKKYLLSAIKDLK